MKPYILVSLWAADDEATERAHAFAAKLHGRRPAAEFLHGEAPLHADLQKAAEAWPEAAFVLFGHGGPALSARRGGARWIDAPGLASILSGRRVYAFACSTFELQAALLWDSFANQAVASCIRIFVGHAAKVMTPLAAERTLTEKMEGALFHMIERFVEGEENEAALIDLGRMYADWEAPVELDLPSQDPDQKGALGWSSSLFLGGFFKSIRVHAKAA